MAKKTWNIAIVGPGWVANAYLTAFRKRDDIRVTHIIGRTREQATTFLRSHGLDCAVHDNLAESLADRTVDIVGVFTPHHLHAKTAIAAAKAGKHIIIEKPVCLSLNDLKKMRATVKSAGVKTIVGFVLRWNPLLMMIRKNIVEGNLGNIIFAEADYLHGIVDKPYTKP